MADQAGSASGKKEASTTPSPLQSLANSVSSMGRSPPPPALKMSSPNPTSSHRSSFAEHMRGTPTSPRASRQPSLTQQALQDLLNNPPTKGGDPAFQGRDWRSIRLGEIVDPELVRFVEYDTSVEDATSILVKHGAPNVVLLREDANTRHATGTFAKSSSSLDSESTAHPSSPHRSLSPLGSALQPPMYSILVVCPLVHSREATIRHIKNTLPQGIPHQVTGQSSIINAQRMIGGDNPVLFTHVVLVLHDTTEVHAIMDQIYSSMAYGNTSVIVVSDPSQRKELIKEAPIYDYEQLHVDRRLQFIYRPLKPSKFAVIFDPQKQRESSTDRNQDSAQQVVISQKLVFEELKRRVGGKNHKVLLVEDNKINQTVILKFLAKIDIETETVQDGVQCTDAVFSKAPGYFSIILCDLHMPNKDGYQACKEIRRWEKKHGYRRHPIIALSANVLGDVYAKCVEAGFNSYVTKPVEFKELSLAMTKFLDPADPSKQPEIMRRK